jgi:putative endonuclease
MRTYHTNILTNNSGTLYIGVTNDLHRRMREHRDKRNEGFTARYSIHRLVYFESTSSILEAIRREKRWKGWKRTRKIPLINSMNPEWKDLSAGWERVLGLHSWIRGAARIEQVERPDPSCRLQSLRVFRLAQDNRGGKAKGQILRGATLRFAPSGLLRMTGRTVSSVPASTRRSRARRWPGAPRARQ